MGCFYRFCHCTYCICLDILEGLSRVYYSNTCNFRAMFISFRPSLLRRSVIQLQPRFMMSQNQGGRSRMIFHVFLWYMGRPWRDLLRPSHLESSIQDCWEMFGTWSCKFHFSGGSIIPSTSDHEIHAKRAVACAVLLLSCLRHTSKPFVWSTWVGKPRAAVGWLWRSTHWILFVQWGFMVSIRRSKHSWDLFDFYHLYGCILGFLPHFSIHNEPALFC